MNNNYTAVIKQDGNLRLGWVEEAPDLNYQKATHDELIETLKITLQEALAFNREEALRESGRHSGWHNPEQNKRSAILRHTEFKDILANKI